MLSGSSSPVKFAPANSTTNRRMIELLGGLALGQGFTPSRLPGVRFIRASGNLPRTPMVYHPGICIVAQGRKTGHFGDQIFPYDANNYLVMAMPVPFETETFATPEEPMLALFIGVTPALVAELVVQTEQSCSPSGPQPQAIESAPLSEDLYNAAVRLLECLRSADDARILGPQCVREITYRVLLGPLGGNLRALAAPSSHFGQIGRVLNRIHTEFARKWDMETLAREAGMSGSTFHARFKAVTSSSPLQYLKSIRLHKARMLMTHDGANAGTAAHQVGYESLSQFSREFKRLFGASPSDAAGQLRKFLIRLE